MLEPVGDDSAGSPLEQGSGIRDRVEVHPNRALVVGRLTTPLRLDHQREKMRVAGGREADDLSTGERGCDRRVDRRLIVEGLVPGRVRAWTLGVPVVPGD